MDLEEYGGLLIPVVMSKIPKDVHLRITCENHGQVWKVDKLMEKIHVEVEACEANEDQKWPWVRCWLSQNKWSGKGNQLLVL